MARLLAALVFLTAVSTTTLMNSGLVVPPHPHPPGTPHHHGHVSANHHAALVLAQASEPTIIAINEEAPLAMTVASALVLGLLAVIAPRLPRPSLRRLGEIATLGAPVSQWIGPVLCSPPRGGARPDFA